MLVSDCMLCTAIQDSKRAKQRAKLAQVLEMREEMEERERKEQEDNVSVSLSAGTDTQMQTQLFTQIDDKQQAQAEARVDMETQDDTSLRCACRPYAHMCMQFEQEATLSSCSYHNVFPSAVSALISERVRLQ